MYNNLPKWLIKDCPAEYCLTEEPGDDRDNKIKELISANPDLKNLRFGNSFCVHVDKVPMAKTNDIRTFTTFKKAKELLSKAQQTYKGKTVGLGIGLFRPFCGIDIDHCINEDGVIADTAQEIMKLFDGAYMETSMSGTGIHIIFLVPVEDQQKSFKNYFTKMNGEACKANGFSDIGGLEFYQGMHDNRYLTLTGNIIPSTKEEYTFNKDKIKQFLSTYMFKPQSTIPTTPPVEFDSSDDEDKAWIKWALQVRKPQDLITAWFRTATGSGGTESEDDLDFCRILAFYCNKNKEVMRVIFEASPYFKSKDQEHLDKWNNREDYRNKYCLDKAIDNQQDVAKNYFKDSFYYDEESKTIKSKEGDDTMGYKIYPVDGKPNTYTFKTAEGIRYRARILMSKTNKPYADYVKAYDCNKKEDLGFINKEDENYWAIVQEFKNGLKKEGE